MPFRTAVVDCLTEVASLPENEIPEEYRPAIQQLLCNFIGQLGRIVPREANLAELFEEGSGDDQLFVSRLALFMGTFLKAHLKLFQPPSIAPGLNLEQALIEGLHYLLMISEVNDDEIFKTCLEFWHHFAKEQYTTDLGLKSMGVSATPAMGSGLAGFFSATRPVTSGVSPGLTAYSSTHSRLRHVLIDRMAKPEEVIIVEDDNGEIIREMTKDTGSYITLILILWL